MERHGASFDSPLNPSNPFSTSAWFRHLVQDAAADDWKFFFPEVRLEGHSVTPLYMAPSRPTHAYALGNVYTSLFAPMCGSSGDRAAAMRAIVSEISEARPKIAALTIARRCPESC